MSNVISRQSFFRLIGGIVGIEAALGIYATYIEPAIRLSIIAGYSKWFTWTIFRSDWTPTVLYSPWRSTRNRIR